MTWMVQKIHKKLNLNILIHIVYISRYEILYECQEFLEKSTRPKLTTKHVL